MKFVISISDKDNGQVQIDCNPNFEVMAQIAREKAERLTPAAAYALGALAYLRRQSLQNLQATLEERTRNGTLPPVYNPDTKLFT